MFKFSGDVRCALSDCIADGECLLVVASTSGELNTRSHTNMQIREDLVMLNVFAPMFGLAFGQEQLCNFYVWDASAKKVQLCRGALYLPSVLLIHEQQKHQASLLSSQNAARGCTLQLALPCSGADGKHMA